MNAKLVTRLSVFAIAGAVLAGCATLHKAEKTASGWLDSAPAAASDTAAAAADKGTGAAANAAAGATGTASGYVGGTASALSKDITGLLGAGAPAGTVVSPNADGSVDVSLGQAATFGRSSHKLSSQIYEPLDRIADYLKQHPNVAVAACGYTDPTGAPEANARLAQRRADAVLTYFGHHGIPSNRLLSGKGCSSFGNKTGGQGSGTRSVDINLIPSGSAAE